MTGRDTPQARPRACLERTNTYGTFLSSHSSGRWRMISSGSASAAITINSAMPLFRVFVAGEEEENHKYSIFTVQTFKTSFIRTVLEVILRHHHRFQSLNKHGNNNMYLIINDNLIVQKGFTKDVCCYSAVLAQILNKHCFAFVQNKVYLLAFGQNDYCNYNQVIPHSTSKYAKHLQLIAAYASVNIGLQIQYLYLRLLVR